MIRLTTLIVVVASLLLVPAAVATAPPVGALPKGPVSTETTPRGTLVSVALPKAPASTGNVWRVARAFDGKVVRQVSEGEIGNSVVLVFRTVAPGRTSLVFALTKGETPKAFRSVTHVVRVR